MAFIPAKASAWFEIPVTDMDQARAFYGSVLQNDLILEESGPNPMAMFAAEDRTASGHIYPGNPQHREMARPSICRLPHRSRTPWNG